jgi:hypothetical protein
MPSPMRVGIAVVLLLIAACCGYLAVAAREAPRETWWAYWYIYALIALPCVAGGIWLLTTKQPRN